MRFPNGYKGVKKLFASEILNIVTTLLLFVTAVLNIINSKKSSDDRFIAAVFILLLIAGIVAILSFLLQIIGINQSRKDGRYFGSALIFLFAGIPADVVASLTEGTFSNIFSSINEVLTLLVTVYVTHAARQNRPHSFRVRFRGGGPVPHHSRFRPADGIRFQCDRRGHGVYRLSCLFDFPRQSKEDAFRKSVIKKHSRKRVLFCKKTVMVNDLTGFM